MRWANKLPSAICLTSRVISIRMRKLLLLGAGAIACSLLSGCAVNGLSFVQDTRVEIVTPRERSQVALPLKLRWTVEDFDGTFAVLVDHRPPRPGESLLGMFKNSEQCKGPGAGDTCTTPEFLADNGVYRTDETEITIERVRKLTGDDTKREFHEATVVLLDGDGDRIGESAWSVRFEIES